jgi:RNA polymerase sigma-70 factor (ECF subfamily)
VAFAEQFSGIRPGRKTIDSPSHEPVVNLSDRQVSREVIESCRLGDRNAFRALYDMYKDRVYSISLYFFHGDRAEASDVTQQVFLKLMTTIGQFRGDAEFSTWLYRLVVNVCLDTARRRKPDAVVFGSAHRDSVSRSSSQSRSQEDEYARAETASTVREAVSELPAKLKIAVLLRYFEDMSYEQMAKALNCSLGTVASRLSRGHKRLAERLKAVAGATR